MLTYQIIRSTARRYLRTSSGSSRGWRPSWLPNWISLELESSVHPHDLLERADQFLAYNGEATEIEVLNWLYATILLLKPNSIIETGTADGFGTIALASACKANGFGRVHSVELDKQRCAKAQKLIEQAGLSNWVQYHCEDSRKFLRNTSIKFQFGFFDSSCKILAEECAICMERGILDGPAVFHDTSPYRTRTMKSWPEEPVHTKFRDALQHLAAQYFNGNIWESTLSRGLTVLMPRTVPVK
jgi:predicted O-methyltransferase YrrM